MTHILLAECESQAQAHALAQFFEGCTWTAGEEKTVTPYGAEVRQNSQASWWCLVSTRGLDWKPLDGPEANYHFLELGSCLSVVHTQLRLAPPCRYAFSGEMSVETVEELLTSPGEENLVLSPRVTTYDQLLAAASAPDGRFYAPFFIYGLRLGFIVSGAMWEQLGSPAELEPLVEGYRWKAPQSRMLSGGIQAPPQAVIDGTQMRVVLDPERAQALHQQGSDLIAEGQMEAAVSVLQEAQKCNPFSPDIHFDKAIALRYLERFPEALESCKSALMVQASGDTLILLHQLRGEILELQGEPEAALEALQSSLDLDPPPYYTVPPLHRKARLLASLGRVPEALAVCDAALQLAPSNANLAQLRAQLVAL